MAEAKQGAPVPFSEALAVWARVALLSFGGPAGQIAVMHRIVVEEKRWVGDGRFLGALNYCMLLPGPEAQQLTVYLGWLMHRTWGGLAAGLLFILPGFLSILALSYVYVVLGEVAVIEGLFFGLKAAVLAIVAGAVARIGKRALSSCLKLLIAAAAFIAIFFFDTPFPLIILAAGLIGFFGSRAGLPGLGGAGDHGAAKGKVFSDEESLLGAGVPSHARPNLAWSLKVSAVFLLLWLGPTALLLLLYGPEDVFSQIALFFSSMAVVTFGGAYAVLAYVAQEAVQTFGWLQPGEMLDGLAMAETTPGPLIQVVQFVGFLAAFRAPGALDPLAAAFLAALLTTWVTFTPCFLWIFLGAPFIEALRSNQGLSGALSAITAAVVGVILNLAVWFSLHVIFEETRQVEGYGLSFDLPLLSSLDPAALGLTLLALALVFFAKSGLFVTLGACSLLGIATSLLGGGS
ncbi:chromate efflux transporter [Limibacillus halophilus]